MNDQEFAALEAALEQAYTWLNWLQKKYRRQTGRDYVMPLRVSFTDADDLERETKDRR